MKNLIFRSLIILALLSTSLVNAKSLKVLSFNVWMVKKLGISISSKLENERLPIIVDRIKKLNPDIVHVQEVWSNPIRDEMIKKMEDVYPHFYYEKYLGFGDGMILFSKYPLEDDSHKKYVFSEGTALEEKYLLPKIHIQKGVLKSIVNVDGKRIQIFGFHLGAVYFDTDLNYYRTGESLLRAKQSREMMEFVLENEDKYLNTILIGDLNSHFFQWHPLFSKRVRKLSYEYDDVMAAGFKDSFMDANNIDLMKTPMEKLDLATYDTQKNEYAMDGTFKDLPKEFIDYIFYRPSFFEHIIPKTAKLVFQEKVTAKELRENLNIIKKGGKYIRQSKKFGFSYYEKEENIPTMLSDHYGVYVEFDI